MAHRLVLLRHAECAKNVERRHGGEGSPLTEAGRLGAQELLRQLKERLVRPALLFVGRRLQCSETASVLNVDLRAVLVPLDFEPFHLGVLSGLSEDECLTRFPLLAARMAQYRRGELEISAVQIPGASDPVAFFLAARRTLSMLASRLQFGDVVVIGTRSMLVGLLNVALGRSPVPGGGYHEILWENCGWCTLSSELRLEELKGVAVLGPA